MTSGTGAITLSFPNEEVGGYAWAGSGSGFSTVGGVVYGGTILPSLLGLGPAASFPSGTTNFSGGVNNVNFEDALNLSSFTVGGVAFAFGVDGGFAQAGFSVPGPITHGGLYPATFGFNETLIGKLPAEFEQDPICSGSSPCTTFHLGGFATGVVNVLPSGEFDNCPGCFYIEKGTFTFVPEPSTVSLLLLGFAGLAVVGRCRRSRAPLPAAV
jgi:hypothetical protein